MADAAFRQFEKGTREGARNAVASGSSKSAKLNIAALWPDEARGVEAEAASPIKRSRGASASSSKRAKPGTRPGKA